MVRFIDVTKTYETGNEALKGVSFRIDDGEFVFLVGPNGSGKSTVTRLLTAELKATSGEISVNGYNLNNIRRSQIPMLRRTLGVVFQDFRLMENKSVWENLAFVMRVVGSSNHAMRKRIPYVLELVGLEGREKELPTQLSGGEQQRLAIARALVNNPEMIIADEPTANVDPVLSVEIMELLAQINQIGHTTTLVVTHEKALVDRLGKRVIAIADGRIVRDNKGKYYGLGRHDLENAAPVAAEEPAPETGEEPQDEETVTGSAAQPEAEAEAPAAETAEPQAGEAEDAMPEVKDAAPEEAEAPEAEAGEASTSETEAMTAGAETPETPAPEAEAPAEEEKPEQDEAVQETGEAPASPAEPAAPDAPDTEGTDDGGV